MAVVVRLLGRPGVERDGRGVEGPKGRKAWALLAYVLSTERPVTRAELASLLFADADDPLGALRWNLAQLRRVLGASDSLGGDDIAVRLPPGSHVDVHVLRRGTWVEASAVPGLGREFLDGMDFPSAPAFEAWLVNERRHLKTSSEAVLREAAMFSLAAGDAERAADHASRLVSLEPLNETYQALLIRAYSAAGDRAAAERQLAACADLFRRELGVEPGVAVVAALDEERISSEPVRPRSEAATRALLEAGQSAVRAGALDDGLGSLRRAVTSARSSGNADLEAQSLFAMGSGLVHCGRNRYEEGAAILHDALRLAEELGHEVLQAAVFRELAWVELLAARYMRVDVLLSQALPLAGDDLAERAAILFVLGMALTETGKYEDSLGNLQASIELAEQAGDAQRVGLSLSMLGKAHVFRRELPEARAAFDRALRVFRENGWTWLVPWTEAYLAELEYVEGRLDSAAQLFEHAFTLACEIDDPCFKTKGEAGLGLIAAARGKFDEAAKRFDSARMWLVRTPDHTWTMATALDELAGFGVANGLRDARRWVGDLEALAGRTGMRELLAHAYLHRHALGDPDALEAASVVARDVDNPFLHQTIAGARAKGPRAAVLQSR